MENIRILNESPKVGDMVMVIMYTDSIENPFEVLIGKLTRLDTDEPYGSIDGVEIDFASEGHTSKIFKIEKIN